MSYSGNVLEDLKQMSYALRAIARDCGNNEELYRYAEAANYALQILDRNRNIITTYEKEKH